MGNPMRTAAECMTMAARMEGFARRDSDAGLRAEWVRMAGHWRGMAQQAHWQDQHRTRPA